MCVCVCEGATRRRLARTRLTSLRMLSSDDDQVSLLSRKLSSMQHIDAIRAPTLPPIASSTTRDPSGPSSAQTHLSMYITPSIPSVVCFALFTLSIVATKGKRARRLNAHGVTWWSTLYGRSAAMPWLANGEPWCLSLRIIWSVARQPSDVCPSSYAHRVSVPMPVPWPAYPPKTSTGAACRRMAKTVSLLP